MLSLTVLTVALNQLKYVTKMLLIPSQHERLKKYKNGLKLKGKTLKHGSFALVS
jgi:hypothetical protein